MLAQVGRTEGSELATTGAEESGVWLVPHVQPRLATYAEAPSLAELWGSLVRGERVIIDNRYADERCFATLQRATEPVPLKRRRVEALQRALLGESPKAIAVDLGVAMSSVANACSESLSRMGAGRLPSRVPVLLVMAAHAARGLSVPPSHVGPGHLLGADTLELSCPRPDTGLSSRVTRSEYQVVRLFVEGGSHLSIAEQCESSPRTIANHLAAVFRKLRVSGRGELLSRLIREQWAP